MYGRQIIGFLKEHELGAIIKLGQRACAPQGLRALVNGCNHVGTLRQLRRSLWINSEGSVNTYPSVAAKQDELGQ